MIQIDDSIQVDLLYLIQRYTVKIDVRNQTAGTSGEWRYYHATVTIENDARRLSATEVASGAASDNGLRQDALANALNRIVRQVKAIEDI